jgi:hypothetical protein
MATKHNSNVTTEVVANPNVRSFTMYVGQKFESKEVQTDAEKKAEKERCKGLYTIRGTVDFTGMTEEEKLDRLVSQTTLTKMYYNNQHGKDWTEEQALEICANPLNLTAREILDGRTRMVAASPEQKAKKDVSKMFKNGMTKAQILAMVEGMDD